MRSLRSIPLLLISFVVTAQVASAQTFIFHLRGDQEVPPVPSASSGGCMGTLDQDAATFTLTCVHDVIGATVMHIHRGAPGVNGPILFDLGDPASPVTATWTGMSEEDITDLIEGDLYINIHTSGRPSGEIRGQILTRTVDFVNFTADGTQVVPPNETSATANCSADLNGPATSLLVQCTHDFPSPTAAHVHEAPAGQNGPIIFTFPSAASPLNANVPLTPQLVADFAATFLYLDIHSGDGSEDEPGAEIRGQIGTPPAAPTTGTIQIVKVTTPAGGSGFSFTDNVPSSPGTFLLNDGQTHTFSNVPAGSYTITELDPSVSGNHTLAHVTCSDSDSTGDLATRTATINVQAGETVTCTFRNFETKPTDTIFVFHLSGDQEVPPVPSLKTGGCMGRFDAGTSSLDLVCTHNVVDATVMHIHQGAAGVNGPILVDLGSPVSPVFATWSGMTPENVADLFAGNLYINIHTGGRPTGEIRGQIVVRSVDTVNFTMDSSQVVPPGESPSTGNCTANLDDPAEFLNVQCTHDLASPDLAHVHDAPFGENGPIIFTFASAASPFSENVPLTPRLVADFAARFLYVDVHGAEGGDESSGDQIRGQIGLPPTPPTTGTIRIIKRTTPAGGAGFTFTDDVPGSAGSFTLDDGDEEVFTNVPPGTYTVTEALPSGYSVSDVACSDSGDSTANVVGRTATINLQAAETVVCTFTNLQSFPSGSKFLFHLSGAQEVPPVPSSATGGCFGQFDAASSSLSLLCTHNVVGATIMHIHEGAPGVNGPIVFDLGDPQSPVEALWSGMTPDQVSDLFNGSLYVNIHTAGRPSGEIRGQILPRTVDAFAFAADASQEVPPTDSPATGDCAADLNDSATFLHVACNHTVPAPTVIHLHDAPPGADGPVVFDFPATNPFAGDVPMTPRLLADFAAGFLYVNIHSANYTEGEIRGQLTGDALATAAEVPTAATWALALLAIALTTLVFLRLR